MVVIQIRDESPRGCLAFDLRDLLEILGDDAGSARWKCDIVDFLEESGARPDLGGAYNVLGGLAGTEMLALAVETAQVIDGRFEAFRNGATGPWVTLEAIDSTFWEVRTEDAKVVKAIRDRFTKVECVEAGAA